METLSIKTNKRNQIIDITRDIEKVVEKSGVRNGVCTVYCPHTTAGITINENADPDVKSDLLNALEKIVPNIRFRHSEGNSDSHLKAALVGMNQSIIISNNQLVLGTWQGIYFCEFDGPRSRKIYIQIIKA